MPLAVNVTTTPYGIPLPDAYGVVTGYSITPDGVSVTVTIWATEEAYNAGAQPGWTHELTVPPQPEALLPMLERWVMPQIASASGVGSVIQV